MSLMDERRREKDRAAASAVVNQQQQRSEMEGEVRHHHHRPSPTRPSTVGSSDSPRQQQDNSSNVMMSSNDSDGNNELDDESTTKLIGTGLRHRKGKIISCAKETIENASRLIRRRVPCAGHLMTPRRLWLNKVPTQCDVVIEFSEHASEEVVQFLLGKLRTSPPTGLGLTVLIRSHESTKLKALYLTAPINVLFKAAEEARLPKRLRPDLGGALKEFTTRESHCFAQIKDTDGGSSLFTSQERQWLVMQILQGLRAGPSDVATLTDQAIVAEGQSIIAAWQESGLITQVFPLHETFALTQLQTSWVKNIFAPQPLDDIAEYFGVKVALYFAWLGHYTCALGVPAVFGTLLWAGLYGRSETAQDIGHVLFSLFNVAWASLYLEAWRRYSVELSFRWGTLSTPPELLEPPRPLYKGPLEESTVTGRLEPKEAPVWKRRAFRYLVSFPVIGLCLLLVFAVMFAMLQFQDWWDDKLPESGIMSCLSVIPKVLLAGAITLMDEAYYKLAVWLNDRENYRLQSKYENHLIGKVALFQFVNSFLSLFYIAFYLRDQEKLKEQLAGLLISRQIIGNLRESVWPYACEQWRLATLSFNMYGALSPTQAQTPTAAGVEKPVVATITTTPPSQPPQTGAPATVTTKTDKEEEDGKRSFETTSTTTTTGKGSTESLPKRTIGQAEIESSLFKYDGTFSDHLEMLVQMGYVVLFSAAFPLAGLCALANNILEIRSDAFKLAHVHQRPFGQRVANIGTWQNALSLLSLAAVIVNCALIGLSGQVSRLWPGLTSTQTVVLIVALEHVMLGLRSALTWLLPELPSWLAAEIARAEHCRREMQCKGTTPRQTPPSPHSSTPASQPESNTPDPLEAFGGSTEEQYIEDFEYDQFAGSSPPYNKDQPSLNDSVFEDLPALSRPLFSAQESPISQTSTVLIRPLMESSGNSLSSIPNNNGDEGPSSSAAAAGACRLNLKQANVADIPPFRGAAPRNSMANSHASRNPSSSKATSQPMQIPEIPPFRKRNSSQSSYINAPHAAMDNTMVGSSSPQNIPEIPPFKARKSTEWTPPASHVEHNMTIASSTGVPEWAKRLKSNNESPHLVHRSTDCIAKELNRHGMDLSETALKNAPSWAALGTSGGPSTSGHAHTSSSTSPSSQAQQQQQQSTSHSHHLMNLLHHHHHHHDKPQSSTSSGGGTKSSADSPGASSSSAVPVTSPAPAAAPAGTHHKESIDAGRLSNGSEDEAAVKAAELAAKKSRIKQSLVKRARSVAIFSLKLKERRQREAEKAAQAAIEHAKIVASATSPPAPGGELSFLAIEQLISVDDVMKHRNSSSGSGQS